LSGAPSRVPTHRELREVVRVGLDALGEHREAKTVRGLDARDRGLAQVTGLGDHAGSAGRVVHRHRLDVVHGEEVLALRERLPVQYARLMPSSRAPGSASSAWSTRTTTSPEIRTRLLFSRRSYVSFTVPAWEFSTGTTPNSASPLVTRENTRRTVSQGIGRASGNTVRSALSL
jgi:hypothetical protein